MTTLDEFRKRFWSGFVAPRMKTDCYDDIHADLELISDALAGPLYSVYKRGECDYVFSDRSRFPTVHDADSFLEWCLARATEYARVVRGVKPANGVEAADRDKLLQCAAEMERLSQMAYEIVKARLSETYDRRRGPLHGKRPKRSGRP